MTTPAECLELIRQIGEELRKPSLIDREERIEAAMQGGLTRDQAARAVDLEYQREEYERGEIASAQSIDHQRKLGNYKAGM